MPGVPYIFGNATTSIPLTNLDANFNTGLTIGNTTVGLGNTVTTLGNVILTNATITPNTSSIAANAVVYSNSSGTLTGNTSVFSVVSGNIGIGNNNPSQKLEVAGNVVLPNNQYFGVKDTTGNAVGFPIYTGSNDAIFGYLSGGTTGISSYQFRVGNNAEVMRITSGARLGVNTNNPTQRLVSYDGGGGSDNIVMAASSGGVQAFMQGDQGGGAAVFGALSNNPMVMKANNTEAARFDTSYNLKMSGGGSVLNSSGNPILAQTGSVIQTQSSFTGSTITATNVGTATFWFQLAFTPKSNSSYFMIYCSWNGIDNGGSGRLQVALNYDTSSGGTSGTQLGFAQLASNSSGTNGCYSLVMNRFAGTTLTAGTTYYFKAVAYKNDTTTTWFCGEYGNSSSITIQEIAV